MGGYKTGDCVSEKPSKSNELMEGGAPSKNNLPLRALCNMSLAVQMILKVPTHSLPYSTQKSLHNHKRYWLSSFIRWQARGIFKVNHSCRHANHRERCCKNNSRTLGGKVSGECLRLSHSDNVFRQSLKQAQKSKSGRKTVPRRQAWEHRIAYTGLHPDLTVSSSSSTIPVSQMTTVTVDTAQNDRHSRSCVCRHVHRTSVMR